MKFKPTTVHSDLMNQDFTFGSAHPPLKYFKFMPEAFAPEWGTEHAACFDLRACLPPNSQITIFRANNQKVQADVTDGCLSVAAGERAMIPTGLILDIPVGYSVRIHPRSGLALKQGMNLVNQEGVVDSDFVDPTMILLHNSSTTTVLVNHGDRIAQAEMQPDIAYEVLETPDKPVQKTDRQGGFGSTGVK